LIALPLALSAHSTMASEDAHQEMGTPRDVLPFVPLPARPKRLLRPASTSRGAAEPRLDAKLNIKSPQPEEGPTPQPEWLEDLLVGDPWEGCEDIQQHGLVEWFGDFLQRKAQLGGSTLHLEKGGGLLQVETLGRDTLLPAKDAGEGKPLWGDSVSTMSTISSGSPHFSSISSLSSWPSLDGGIMEDADCEQTEAENADLEFMLRSAFDDVDQISGEHHKVALQEQKLRRIVSTVLKPSAAASWRAPLGTSRDGSLQPEVGVKHTTSLGTAAAAKVFGEMGTGSDLASLLLEGLDSSRHDFARSPADLPKSGGVGKLLL